MAQSSCPLTIPNPDDLAHLDKNNQFARVKEVIAGYEALKTQKDIQNAVLNSCAANIISLVFSIVSKWHDEVTGDEQYPGTKDESVGNLALSLYRLLLETFDKLDDYRTKKVADKITPIRHTLLFLVGQMHWTLANWVECRRAMKDAIEADPQGPFVEDAAYVGFICSLDITMMGPEWKKVAMPRHPVPLPRDFTESEMNQIAESTQYICVVNESTNLVEIKFHRAMRFFYSNRFREAALLFKDIVYTHPKDELSPYVGMLYFETLRVLAEEIVPPLQDCKNEFLSELRKFAKNETAPATTLMRDAQFREVIADLVKQNSGS